MSFPHPPRRRIKTVTRDKIKWKIVHKGDPSSGVLNEADIRALASTHDIDEERLRRLSLRLRTTFEPELNLSQPDLRAERRKAGQKKLKQANDLIRSAEDKLSRASSILNDIGFSNPFAHVGMPNVGDARLAEFEAALKTLSECHSFFRTMERTEGARFLAAPDARKVTDERRTILCVTLFNLWLDLERTLTYTTDPISGERTGPLIEFVNDVVGRLTEPSMRLNGEAIKRELDDFRA